MTRGWSLHWGRRALTPALSQREREPIPAVPSALMPPRESQDQPRPPLSDSLQEGQCPPRSGSLLGRQHPPRSGSLWGQYPPRSGSLWEGQYPPLSCDLWEGRDQARVSVLLPLGDRIPTAPAFHPLPLGEGWGEGSSLP